MRVGLIGLGGMGKVVVEVLAGAAGIEIVGAIVAKQDYQQARESGPANVPVLEDMAELLAKKPDVIAECAGHEAVREYGTRVLSTGIDLLVISIGALADEALFRSLKEAAKTGSASMYLPAGAVGGIDALRAASLSGLEEVTYRGIKPARAWLDSPAQEIIDLTALEQRQCFFSGTAREAALSYPRNSNVAATVALAGPGFDSTRVELIADPQSEENIHEIEVKAATGNFFIKLSGKPLKDSPKTSALAAYSVAKCLLDLDSAVVI